MSKQEKDKWKREVDVVKRAIFGSDDHQNATTVHVCHSHKHTSTSSIIMAVNGAVFEDLQRKMDEDAAVKDVCLTHW